MDIAITIIIIILCLALEAFFSGSEIGVISADQMKLRHDASKGSSGARLAIEMLKNPEWLLSTTLVGTNISVVTNTTITTALVLQLFPEYGRVIAVVLVAPLIWIFGEIVPKSVFQQRATAITPIAIFILKFFSILFFPILIVFSFSTKILSKFFGASNQNPFTMREEIQTMMRMPSQSDIQPVEKKMIGRLFNFSETTVQQIMVPLIDVACIAEDELCSDAVRLSIDASHVRLPVYKDRIDRVTGMLYTLDLIGMDLDQPIKPFIKKIRYVPGSLSIRELFHDLRVDGDVMAMVVDEFGGACGIVTIEDIMEEVVDEHDRKEDSSQWIRKISEKEYMVSARIELARLRDSLHLILPEGKYLTLAGYILDKLHEVPEEAVTLMASGVKFTIHKATPQAILEVKIEL